MYGLMRHDFQMLANKIPYRQNNIESINFKWIFNHSLYKFCGYRSNFISFPLTYFIVSHNLDHSQIINGKWLLFLLLITTI